MDKFSLLSLWQRLISRHIIKLLNEIHKGGRGQSCRDLGCRGEK